MGIAKTFLAIGIAVVLTIFVAYGLYALYEMPTHYGAYYGSECQKTYDCNKPIMECEKTYEYGTPNYSAEGRQACEQAVYESNSFKSCQELYKTCTENAYKQSPEYKFARNNFFILIIVAIICIIAGSLLTMFEGIGSGIFGGGILIFIWSLIYTYSFWQHFGKPIKLGAIGLILVLLIFFGWRKLEKGQEK